MKNKSGFASKRLLHAAFVGVLVAMGCKDFKSAKQSKTSLTAVEDKDGFRPIFNAENLEGWSGDLKYWQVKNGILVGRITPEAKLENNTFIRWMGGQPDNFELKAEFRISEDGNSGINYRSEKIGDSGYGLRGYQADIDGKHHYTGQNYEEKKRATLAYRGESVVVVPQNNGGKQGSLAHNIKNNAWQSRVLQPSLGSDSELRRSIRTDTWNQIHIIAQGNTLKHFINGTLMSVVQDRDTMNRASKGYIGLQLHRGPPMEVAFRNILLKNLPQGR